MSSSRRISPVKQRIDLAKERAEALSIEIKCLMIEAAKTGEQSKVTAISERMDQLNQELQSLGTSISQDMCYCPRVDELETALRLLRSKGNNRSKSRSPIRIPIQEENIYDEPHTSTECSSPAPNLKDLTYYNYSVIMDQRSRHDSGTNAIMLSPGGST